MNTTSEEPKPIAARELRDRLEEMVWEAADRIGHSVGWYQIQSYSDEEVAGYANGIKNTITGLVESYDLQSNWRFGFVSHQFEGALGERLRRLNSPKQKLKSRALNNLVTEIRDKRIALLDRCDDENFSDQYRAWQKRIWAFERKGFESDELCNEFERVKGEFDALEQLRCHLWHDRHWVDKRLEVQKAKAGVPV